MSCMFWFCFKPDCSCSCFELFILVVLQQTMDYHLLCLFLLVRHLCIVVVCFSSVIFVSSYTGSHVFWKIKSLSNLGHKPEMLEPIKGSKDSDYSLVSTKNLVKNLALVVGAQWPQPKVSKPYHLWCYPQNSEIQNFQIFFQCELEDFPHRRGLNSSLAQSPCELGVLNTCPLWANCTF